ncbi:MAG: AarF/UbiB family protein, partial [Chloroflexia bacterium]
MATGFPFLPRRWQRFREISHVLLRHGFGFLVESVGPRWLRFPRRRAAPALPPAHHLRLALEELGPTFIKLGQVLSTRPDLLPPAFVAELALLQDRVPPFPVAEVRRIVEEELGAPVQTLFAHFEEEPLAAASL